MSQVQPAAQTNNAKRLNRDQHLQIKTPRFGNESDKYCKTTRHISKPGQIHPLYSVHRTQESCSRHRALIKPPLSEEVKRKRREWAEARKDWTVEDWMAILWTDEIWATDGQHKRDWIGEEVNATCVVEKVRKSLGWMFWGSFAGIEEGPWLFWEKEWGSITSESYSQRIVPLIDGMVSMRPWVSVMQDNAPSHSAAGTIEEFRERFITPIDWLCILPT
ncbi:hypothetical protein K3495_g9794 [Podosphaera aphanis]|nr:hypothetical protein K3495_g9794 [Podosphaera aphanis]